MFESGPSFGRRTALVTGAAHGFGRAIAVAFAERGASVWACDVVEDELRETGQIAGAAHARRARWTSRTSERSKRWSRTPRLQADAWTSSSTTLVACSGRLAGR